MLPGGRLAIVVTILCFCAARGGCEHVDFDTAAYSINVLAPGGGSRIRRERKYFEQKRYATLSSAVSVISPTSLVIMFSAT